MQALHENPYWRHTLISEYLLCDCWTVLADSNHLNTKITKVAELKRKHEIGNKPNFNF